MKIKLYFSSYNHNKDDKQKLNKERVCNNSKRKAVNYPFEKLSKILHRELLKGEISTWMADDTTRVGKMNIMNDEAYIFYSKLPETLINLHTALDSLYIKTHKDEGFFIIE